MEIPSKMTIYGKEFEFKYNDDDLKNPVDYKRLYNGDLLELKNCKNHDILIKRKIIVFMKANENRYKFPSHKDIVADINTTDTSHENYINIDGIKNLLKKSNLITRGKAESLLAFDGDPSGRKRIVKATWYLLERALLQLIRIANRVNILLSAPQFTKDATNIERLIRQECLRKGRAYPSETFLCSNNWRLRFFKKYKLTMKSATGKAGSVDMTRDEVLDYITEQIPNYEQLKLNQIWNLDESALFYEINGNKIISFIGSEVHGREDSKKRITIVAFICANGLKITVVYY